MLRQILFSILVGAGMPGPSVTSSGATSSDIDPYVPETLHLRSDDVPPDLMELPVPPATRKGLDLRRDAWNALRELLAAAERDGVLLRVISAYRSFEYQAQLYERAVRKHGPDQRWVAAPGTSEHQLGTAVDVADAALEHVLVPSFAGTPEGIWLQENALRFGFVVSYTEQNEARTGMRPEPWHVRFLGAKGGGP
jgi:D-alanyl-D-alanine carboxypeptidase